MIVETEQLNARAGEFALANDVEPNPWTKIRLWSSFDTDVRRLQRFAKHLTENRVECSQPAEDWLLDHIAFLEIKAQEVRRTFTRRTMQHLPKFGTSKVPRIMAICDDYMEHVDGHYQVGSFEDYINAYQEVSVLSLLECWTLQSAMRVVIIRRLAQVMAEVEARYRVCNWTSSVLSQVIDADVSVENINMVFRRALDGGSLTPTHIVHIAEHLNEWEEVRQPVRDFITIQIENGDASLTQMVHYEHGLQAELQVTSGNLIQSLHLLEQLPWQATFHRISHVERILSSQEDGDYERLDEASQDALRMRVGELAWQLRVPETLLAHTVIRLSNDAAPTSPELLPPRSSCIAYYLLDPRGEIALRRELAKLVQPRHLWAVGVRRHPWLAYLSTGTVVFFLLLFVKGLWVSYGAEYELLDWVTVSAVLALPTSEWVVNIVHGGIMRSLQPRILLRYDFSTGLPPDAVTMVVVPVIWSTVAQVDAVLDQIVVHALANRQVNIYFAVLADFTDAPAALRAEDDMLVAHAQERLRNIRSENGHERFFLLHRGRRHNLADGIHMGWERKRGKLVEFVELLSGKETTSYTVVDGDRQVLQRVRYVFTIDEDTELPMGVVSRMVGTMHLPYNRPRLNAAGTRVVEGYGVLEPRLAVSLESAQRSHFARLWAGEPGIDPYAFAVSDPYQNLFGSAMFVGKGLFDVEAFKRTLVDTIPDNTVLSHDYLEGGFLRTGLTPDIEVIEDYPETYYAYQRRAHRWIRGDWQLLPWLWPTSKNRSGKRVRMDLPAVTRWQIFDSLRRSLVTPSLFLLALLGVTALPGQREAFLLIVVLTLSLPFLRSIVAVVTEHGTYSSVRIGLLQSAVKLITLPFDAAVSVDAVVRTLYRMLISRRRLLEWVTSAETNRRGQSRRAFVYEPLGYVLVLVFTVAAWPTEHRAMSAVAMVLALLWWTGDPVMRMLTRLQPKSPRSWVAEARPQLQEWAQQIWRFYDDYVTATDSWLPPDNVQFRPKKAIAHRTSPTNIGLYLVSVLAAKDLGFIDKLSMMERLDETLQCVTRLEKWRGHLYNWYDTESAKPLPPRYVSTVDSGNLVAYLMVLRQGLLEIGTADERLRGDVRRLATIVSRLIDDTDFGALYDADERVFCLGYHVETNRRETVRYDLLASEARQASFVAIALGQIPVSHWFGLGRTMTMAGGHKTLLSWSGTMFEYLMPSLIMRTYKSTVWESTYRGVIARQAEYAAERGVPFGISESGYYAFDYKLNYQYRAFGVPGLGFERGLENNLVVAPYASIIALPLTGAGGLQALRRFEQLGAKGDYGFCEAIDFTAGRLPKGSRYEVVQSFMAHHQGMSLLALTNILAGDVMIARFHRDPNVRAARLLLQERLPVKPALVKHTLGVHAQTPDLGGSIDELERTYTEPPLLPEVNVLSNGRITSVTTYDGSGRISWNGLAVTRWRDDAVLRSSGMIVYLRDVSSEDNWTATAFPGAFTEEEGPGTGQDHGRRTVFRLDKSVMQAHVHGIWSRMEVAVAPDVDAEVRRLRLVNDTGEVRTIEISSFLELALASQRDDSAHPAFQRLFVETEHDRETEALLARRRPRQDKDGDVWAVHTMYADGKESGDYEYETDRATFVGRGYSLEQPMAMPERLRGTVGAVTDPAFIMHRTLRLQAHDSAIVYIITGVAASRASALHIVHQLREPAQVDRQFHLAWMRSQIDLRHLHLTPGQANTAQMLAGRLVYQPPLTAQRRQAILNNGLGQSSLWAHGISGDLPIVTVTVSHVDNLRFVVLLARQHQYLWSLGVSAHLIVLDESPSGYQDAVMNGLRDALAARGIVEPQLIQSLKASQLSNDERNLLVAVSVLWLRADGPSLRGQMDVDEADGASYRERHLPVAISHHRPPFGAREMAHEGEFYNGWGSFVDGGKAYRIHVRPGQYLQKPWANILTNPHFGCVVTELGTGYTWWGNARQFKLTPWANDPVLDQPGEVLYLKDVDTGEIWSATPAPSGGERLYTVTHGFGYTTVQQQGGDMEQILEMTVPPDDPVKVVRLHLFNRSERVQRIAVTYYAEWVLGVSRAAEVPHIISDWNAEHQMLWAQNTYQDTFRDRLAFLQIAKLGEPSERTQSAESAESAGSAEPQFEGTVSAKLDGVSYTADGTHFFGATGGATLARPAELCSAELSGRIGVFSNPCGAVQMTVELPPFGTTSVQVLLGCASSVDEAVHGIEKYAPRRELSEVSSTVKEFWNGVTEQVQVRTPDRALDILLNGWLLYQALSSRLFGRTGFYQAGGAYGFRDQLQDSLAFLHADSSITRRQILLHAAHQYEEGDVQHWWHGELGKGIRTRCSDDLLWLPYVVSRYIEQTGDTSVLRESVPFLQSPVLDAHETERYEDSSLAPLPGSILEHCVRAIYHALQFGGHGLPLIGTGDWNDGMNDVGPEGRGESVWLGWFLLLVLKKFISSAGRFLAKSDTDGFTDVAKRLEEALNRDGWDGAWFRRAFTDEGGVLGSVENHECRIDAIAQSFAVISGGTSRDRQRRAMRSFDRELVDREMNVVKLLTRPFDKTHPGPGYIQGYPPGIRENGGQYTHGAVWSIIAWAMLGEGDKAYEMFTMLNPISHTMTPHEVMLYGNEPYVMSADVYTAEPHRGQGGWSWYTGAAGWMYQAGLEYILGIKRQQERLFVEPCVPLQWESFEVNYRYGKTLYIITVRCGQTEGGPRFVVDGQSLCVPYVELRDDGETHEVTCHPSPTLRGE
ncbi:carbohydrate-binding protein [Alicyclobacillus curvatus]|nr:carbohydrate-binding protein [Alicyclobacillus curvatus]